MRAHWTLAASDGRGAAPVPVAEWTGVLPFGWRGLASGRCRGAGRGVAGHLRSGVARFQKLADLVRFAVADTAPGLTAAMAADAAALSGLGGQLVVLTGDDAVPPAELQRLCTATGRAIDSLRRDTFLGPRRVVNAARAGRGPLAPLAGLRLDAGFDAPDAPLPMGLVFAALPGSLI